MELRMALLRFCMERASDVGRTHGEDPVKTALDACEVEVDVAGTSVADEEGALGSMYKTN